MSPPVQTVVVPPSYTGQNAYAPAYYPPQTRTSSYYPPRQVVYPSQQPSGYGQGQSATPLYQAPAPTAGGTVAPLVATAPPAAPPPPPAVAPSGGTFVSVTFVPTATSDDVDAFLKAYSATIAEGPSQEGAYRIRVSDQDIAPDQLAQVVDSMRSQTAVVGNVTN